MNLTLRQRIILEIIINGLLLLFYSIFYLKADSLIEQTLFGSLNAAFFPKVIILCIVVMSCILVIDSILMWNNYTKNKISYKMNALMPEKDEIYPMSRVFAYIGVLFLYLIGFYYIGFIYSTPIIIILVAYLLGMKNIFIGAIVAILFTLALDYASLQFLQILLPSGILFES